MYLVLGGTGFLGRALLEDLAKKGLRLRCLYMPDEKFDSIGGVEYVQGRLEDIDSLKRAVEGVGVVIHLAAVINSEDPQLFYQVNLQGTQNLLDASRNSAVRRFVYVSTVDAGFKQKGHYGLSKAQAEQRIIDSGLAYTILRPTVIYGPNDNFISNLLKMIHRLPVIPVLGDGRYLRQPIYIDDVVRTIEKVLEQENGQNKIYHLAGPQAHSMLEIIDIIQKGLSTRKWKVYLPLIPTRIILFSCAKLFRLRAFPREQIANIEMDKIADITGLTEELSIYPINLREGLNKLIGGKNGN